jgi:hypothetical protein
MQNQDPACGQRGVAAHRALPIRGPQVPLPRVDLRGHSRIRPPGVGHRKERSAGEDAGIEHRRRQPRPPQQVAKLGLCHRADSFSDLHDGPPQQGGMAPRPGIKLVLQQEDRTVAALDGAGHNGPHVAQARHCASSVRDRPGGQCHADRVIDHEPRHPLSAPDPDRRGAPGRAARRYEHGDDLGFLRPDPVMAQRGRPSDHASGPGIEQCGHLPLDGGWGAGRREVGAG